jgi:hypothetical protein
MNRISGVMVSMLASSVVDYGFEPWSGQTKDYKICICFFSTKHAVSRRMSKDWLAQNEANDYYTATILTGTVHPTLYSWQADD